jgi:hypothetical protein
MERRNICRLFLWEIQIEKDHLHDVGIDDEVKLKCILMKLNGWLWTGLI